MGEQAWVWVLAAGLVVLIPVLFNRNGADADAMPVEVPTDEEPHRR